jgi:hypothetical protein
MNAAITPLHECRDGNITCGCRPENNAGTGICGKVLGRFSPKENPASDFVGS